MSNTDVVYSLSLKDFLSKKLDEANAKANTLESTMGSLKSTLAWIGGTAALVSFGRSALQAFDASAKSVAQLEAGLKSTGNTVGLTSQAMQDQAAALQKLTTYDDDAIVGMQSLLLTFTNVKDKIFTEATPAILDLATRMGGDLNGAALQVGKALQDPITGMTALRRSGVSFDEAQQKVIKSLVETNRLGEAQTMILAELNKEFGGSAEAAALVGLGPWQQLQNVYGDVQEQVGQLILKFGQQLLPVVQKLVKGLGSLVEWLDKNGESVKVLAGGVVAMYTAVQVAIPLMEGMGLATTAMLGPLGLLATAIGLVTYGLYEWANAEDNLRNIQNKEVTDANKHIKEALDERVKMYEKSGMKHADAVKKVSDATRRTYVEDLAQVDKDIQATESKMATLKNLGYSSQAEDMQKGLSDLKQKKAVLEGGLKGVNEFAQGGVATPSAGGMGTGGGASATPSKSKSVAQGTKVTTINVSIKDLIGEYNMNVTNVKEGSEKIKQIVVDALMGAVNDFQLIVQ